jgi:hypothetical protein
MVMKSTTLRISAREPELGAAMRIQLTRRNWLRVLQRR